MNLSPLCQTWVRPFYREFLHGNFLFLKDEDHRNGFVQFVQQALAALEAVTVDRLMRLAWREQLAGSWFTGLKGWTQFTQQIGDLLLESRACYAGQGYCFALARFANEDSIEYLKSYLDTYLPQKECYYDQNWALSALLWLDKARMTQEAKIYLQSGGLWERFVADKPYWNIVATEQRFHDIMVFCDVWFHKDD